MNYVFLRFPNFRLKAVTLSYDDGVVYDKKLIEILDKYGLKCTFNLNSGLFAEKEGERRLTAVSALNLYKDSVHEIAIHGERHLSLTTVPKGVATLDVINDRKNLEKLFGRIVNGMAYANGAFDDNVVQILRNCGVKYSRTCNSTGKFDIPVDWLKLNPTCHHTDVKLNEYVDTFLNNEKSWYFWANSPMLFYLWGHSYEFNDNNNWDIIEKFAKRVGNRDDIWYATNGEIYEYVKAFENLEYSANGCIIKNNSNIDLYLCYYDKDILIEKCSQVSI